jgi:hypothetical protein
MKNNFFLKHLKIVLLFGLLSGSACGTGAYGTPQQPPFPLNGGSKVMATNPSNNSTRGGRSGHDILSFITWSLKLVAPGVDCTGTVGISSKDVPFSNSLEKPVVGAFDSASPPVGNHNDSWNYSSSLEKWSVTYKLVPRRDGRPYVAVGKTIPQERTVAYFMCN